MAIWGFGIVQSLELERTGQRALGELCEKLAAIADVRLRPFVAQSHAELARAVDDEEVALAWLPPIPTIELEDSRLATVLAIPLRNGQTSYSSALVTRRGIRPNASRDLATTLAELRGRRVAWVDAESAAGYLVPRMQLAASGVEDPGSFWGRETFVRTHPAVIDAVVSGQAEVGATYCQLDAQKNVVRGAWIDEEGLARRPIEVLATFGPIPNDALVVSNLVPVADRSALTRAMQVPRVRELLGQLVGATDFRMPSATHYEPLRHLLRTARARGSR